MKSPQVKDDPRYSELQVLQSAAGYYVGTLYNDPDMGWVPGTRDSFDYYDTPEEARTALLLLEEGLLQPRTHA